MSGRKPRLISPAEAKTSLAMRLGKTVDRAAQIEVRLGLRPYNVFLVWTKWTGDERGEGKECVVCRAPLLPTPIVEDLSAISRTPQGVGNLPMGSVRVRGISVSYTADYLKGKMIPEKSADLPEPYDFFYEVAEDGRHGEAERMRFRLASEPAQDAAQAAWSLLLERQSRDTDRKGRPVAEPAPAPPDVWTSRMLTAPEED